MAWVIFLVIPFLIYLHLFSFASRPKFPTEEQRRQPLEKPLCTSPLNLCYSQLQLAVPWPPLRPTDSMQLGQYRRHLI